MFSRKYLAEKRKLKKKLSGGMNGSSRENSNLRRGEKNGEFGEWHWFCFYYNKLNSEPNDWQKQRVKENPKHTKMCLHKARKKLCT